MENKKNKTTPEQAGTGIGCLIVVIIIMFCLFKCGCSDKNTSQEQASADSITIQSTAEILGQEAIKNSLKSPTSAEFDNERVFYGDTIPGDTINLIGTVDADNSFGAKLRNNFCVEMVFDKSFRDLANWRVVYINITPLE